MQSSLAAIARRFYLGRSKARLRSEKAPMPFIIYDRIAVVAILNNVDIMISKFGRVKFGTI